MELVSPILEIASYLWTRTIRHIKYTTNLRGNLTELSNVKNELCRLHQELTRRVECEERQQMKRTERVSRWLQRAEVLEREVEVILQNGDSELQKRCLLNGLPRNCYSSYRLGKEVITKLDEVRLAINNGSFHVVAYWSPRAAVDEIPVENTVGLDSLLEEVWGCLMEASVGIIGLYGIGGVGKTTLLKKINNEFLRRIHHFELVIWVVVSKEVNMEKIQDVIRKRLDIADEIWASKSEEERPTEILRILRTRKFVLMIDDIWKRIELANLGIPVLLNHQIESKVIFTSRSRDVCGRMEAQRRIRVGCLAREEGIHLLQMKVGEVTLKSHPDIPKLAKVVAEECEGLPLALITIGRAMSSRKNPAEWDHAIKALQSYPSEFSGIGDDVFPVLKFSYDSLPSDRVRNCFLYFSIFPEDYNIRKDELIKLWIGEGLLDNNYGNINDAINLGEFIIGTLKLTCLLESNKFEEFVRMHDMIRAMALWIAKTGGRDRHKILVLHDKSTEAHRFVIQDETERVSVWGHHDNTESFTGSEPHCPNLLSLFVKDNMLNSFSNGFFEHLQVLKVLDLSGNLCLYKLPESIGELVSLHYLNLSETAITELPLELKKLKKLRILLLNYARQLGVIPREVILSLSCLQIFSMITDEFRPSEPPLYDEEALLRELEHLEELGDLQITIRSASGATTILESPKLQKCIKKLSFNHLSLMRCLKVSYSSLERMEHLVKLEIMFCAFLNELEIFDDGSITRQLCFKSLHEVVIWECGLSDATWLIYTPNLQKLTVADCKMWTLIETDKFPNGEHVQIFSSLETIHLQALPELRWICPKALPFPALIEIHVDQCNRLGQLPLNASSASGLKQIQGTASWWNQLTWEDYATKHAFESKFKEIPDYGEEENHIIHRASVRRFI